MQTYCFIEYSKDSCLDLQFILLKTAKKACNIQKTIIFINTISNIFQTISIIQAWIKQLGYHESSMTSIRPFDSTKSDWDKSLIAKVFYIPGDENLEYMIFVAIDVYGIGINNPDVKLIIQ